MARSVTRQTLKLFGTSGASSNFGQFGSAAASAPVTTKTISTIQSLSAWLNGWQTAVALGQAPYLEDMNAFSYVMAYMQYYLFQEGVPEWDSGTTYFAGSVVKNLGNSGFVEFYNSLVDSNTNNALPTRTNNANWQFMYAMDTTNGIVLPSVGANIAMNSHKLTGLAAGASNGDSLRFEQWHVLQIPLIASETTGGSTSSATFVSLGANATITPQFTTSKILGFVVAPISNNTNGAGAVLGVTGTTTGDIFTVAASPAHMTNNTGTNGGIHPISFSFLDAPGSTSAQTYQIRIAALSGTAAIGGGVASGVSTQIILMEVK